MLQGAVPTSMCDNPHFEGMEQNRATAICMDTPPLGCRPSDGPGYSSQMWMGQETLRRAVSQSASSKSTRTQPWEAGYGGTFQKPWTA